MLYLALTRISNAEIKTMIRRSRRIKVKGMNLRIKSRHIQRRRQEERTLKCEKVRNSFVEGFFKCECNWGRVRIWEAQETRSYFRGRVTAKVIK